MSLLRTYEPRSGQIASEWKGRDNEVILRAPGAIANPWLLLCRNASESVQKALCGSGNVMGRWNEYARWLNSSRPL
jgi:hypothetical protein